MHQVNAKDAIENLLDLLDEAVAGEEVFIVRDDSRVVKLVPVAPKSHRKSQFGVAKGKIKIADDFDEPLEDFREYMQ